MLTLSDQDLDQLKCSICHRLLSLFPIYSTKNAENQLLSICGRCQLPNDNLGQYLRDEIYENLAKILIFPCINQQYGCMIGLYPADVKQHELECCYQQQDCIFSKRNGCNWRGGLKFVLKHYKEQHNDLILMQNNQFEINIVKDDEIVNILPYKDEIFLFKFRYNHQLKRLKCYLGGDSGGNTVCEDYYILMHLNGDNWTLNYKFQESNFNIKIPLLDVKINGVANPRGVIEISAPAPSGGDPQNSTSLQCKYGCSYTITDSDDLETHYYTCAYRTFVCFSDRTTICSWQGHRKDLSEHIFNHHKATINNVNDTLIFNIKRNITDQYYINDNGSLYHLNVYNNRKRFDWKIEQINEAAIKYDKIMCELCVVDRSYTKRFVIGKLLENTMKSGQLIRLCKGVTFALSKDQIKSCTSGNNIHFYINFTKIKT